MLVIEVGVEGALYRQALQPIPWPQPGMGELQQAVPPQDHPGERQMERLERQAEVLHRRWTRCASTGGCRAFRGAECAVSALRDGAALQLLCGVSCVGRAACFISGKPLTGGSPFPGKGMGLY